MNPIVNQLTVNAIAAWLIQVLKNSHWRIFSWINPNTPWVSRFVALTTAIATAAGIHASYTGGTLTVTNLTLTAALSGIWAVIQNYITQHIFYKAAFKS